MAATATWQFSLSTAAASVWSDLASGILQFKKANDNNNDLANPLVKPSSGQFDWSWKKGLRLKITGTFSQLQSLLLVLQGANPTGVAWYHKFYTPVAYDALSPILAQAVTGDDSSFTTLSASQAWSNAATITSAQATGWGDWLQMYIRVADSVSPGEMTSQNLVAQYDEIP